jgi:hypothetical protein
VLGSTERSADLRAYYAKHTKSDRLDSVLLARLPLLHPEGLHHERGLGPCDPLRRATKVHSTLVKRRVGHRLKSSRVEHAKDTRALVSTLPPVCPTNWSRRCWAPAARQSQPHPAPTAPEVTPPCTSAQRRVWWFSRRTVRGTTPGKVQGLVLLNPTEMPTESRLGEYLLPVLGVAQILASGLAIKLGMFNPRLPAIGILLGDFVETVRPVRLGCAPAKTSQAARAARLLTAAPVQRHHRSR